MNHIERDQTILECYLEGWSAREISEVLEISVQVVHAVLREQDGMPKEWWRGNALGLEEEELCSRMEEMYLREGKNMKQISEAVGIAYDTVRFYFKLEKQSPSGRDQGGSGVRISPEMRNQVAELRLQGKSYPEIARKTGISKESAANISWQSGANETLRRNRVGRARHRYHVRTDQTFPLERLSMIFPYNIAFDMMRRAGVNGWDACMSYVASVNPLRLISVIDQLPEREKGIIYCRYRDGYTLRECGERYSLTHENIAHMLDVLLVELRSAAYRNVFFTIPLQEYYRRVDQTSEETVPDMTPDTLEQTFKQAGFSQRVSNSLENAGLHVLKELAELQVEDLQMLRCIGPKALDEIAFSLKLIAGRDLRFRNRDSYVRRRMGEVDDAGQIRRKAAAGMPLQQISRESGYCLPMIRYMLDREEVAASS